MDEKIEQLAKEIQCSQEEEKCFYCVRKASCCVGFDIALKVIKAGYRKESETAREILAEIDDLTICIIDGSNEFEKGYFQAIADMKTAIKDLLKEKYGVEVD